MKLLLLVIFPLTLLLNATAFGCDKHPELVTHEAYTSSGLSAISCQPVSINEVRKVKQVKIKKIRKIIKVAKKVRKIRKAKRKIKKRVKKARKIRVAKKTKKKKTRKIRKTTRKTKVTRRAKKKIKKFRKFKKVRKFAKRKRFRRFKKYPTTFSIQKQAAAVTTDIGVIEEKAVLKVKAKGTAKKKGKTIIRRTVRRKKSQRPKVVAKVPQSKAAPKSFNVTPVLGCAHYTISGDLLKNSFANGAEEGPGYMVGVVGEYRKNKYRGA